MTPPESAFSWFPPGCLPVEENTHHDDYRCKEAKKKKHYGLCETVLWDSVLTKGILKLLGALSNADDTQIKFIYMSVQHNTLSYP